MNVVPLPVWWSFGLLLCIDFFLKKFVPQFTQHWYQPAKTTVGVKWAGLVQWFESFTVVKWIEKPLDLIDRVKLASPWGVWLIVGVYVSLIFVLPWVVNRVLRGGHSKRAMLDVAANAVNALQSWKGHVSRFTLWRVGNLAREEISPADKTLRVMLELWEQQQIRK